jgi:hypothetical protein
MGKKLNLVLRDPVKLHQDEAIAPELPSPFEDQESLKRNSNAAKLKRTKKEESIKNLPKGKSNKTLDTKPEVRQNDKKDYREEMSLRVRQVWECFCEIAGADEDLKNSFEVTRAEVMAKAGVGSTNTYRNALQKFQDLGLIEIELRPGVINGSLFHLTKKGLEQVGVFVNNKKI